MNQESSFRVVVRIRPLNEREFATTDAVNLSIDGERKAFQIEIPGKENTYQSFTFDAIADESATQGDFFDLSGVSELLDYAVAGYNATVFAFGQTGSGKTFTCSGPQDNDDPEYYGVIQRSAACLYEKTRQNQDFRCKIRMSYLEIYNERVLDLLNHTEQNLQLRYNTKTGFYVENLFLVECESFEDMMAVINEGLGNRKVASHNLNRDSSRSHCILTMHIDSTSVDPVDGRELTRWGKVSFVDLAGSERVNMSGSTGSTLTETRNINRSLLSLGNVISVLSDPSKHGQHVPYRDSKLTKLLMNCLGGDGIALMIACVSPACSNYDESMKSLRYAQRAKNIKNRPLLQIDPREQLIQRLREEIKTLRLENLVLKERLGEDVPLSGRLSERPPSQPLSMRATPRATPEPMSDRDRRMIRDSESLLLKTRQENEALYGENVSLVKAKEQLLIDFAAVVEENEKLSQKIDNIEQVFARTKVSQSNPQIDRPGTAIDDEIAKLTRQNIILQKTLKNITSVSVDQDLPKFAQSPVRAPPTNLGGSSNKDLTKENEALRKQVAELMNENQYFRAIYNDIS